MAYIKPTEIIVNGRGLTSSASSATGISPVTLNVNTATTATLGIIQVGSGLAITPDGVLSATGGAGNGYTGSAGSNGSVGFTGSAGSTGTQGNAGFTGSAGSTGTQGSIGFTGSAGSTGTQGSIGFTGSRGIDGVTTTTTVAAVTNIIGTTSTTAGIPGFADRSYTGSLNDGYTLTNGDLYVWKGGDTAGSTSTSIEYLVVAGGGGGSFGGGGAGGLLTASGFEVATGTAITVTVGAGGAGQNSLNTTGTNGADSVFSTITSTGGGGGAKATGILTGSNGGSGGGGGNNGSGGTGVSGQGFAGGTGYTDNASYGLGGGGGGASVVGQSLNSVSNAGGNGGAGTASSISGSSVTYAGGGGGGGNVTGSRTGGTGGVGGGGNGSMDGNATSGTTNLGGGGGGAGNANGIGGSGGSGIVIIRYADTYPVPAATTGSPTVLTTSGYRIYSWTTVGSGSITFASSAPTTGPGWVLVGNIKGIPGEYAAIGYTGSAGAGYTGSAGSTGTQGNVGFTGSTGSTGTQGNVGFTGSIGSTGTQGEVGYTGSVGFVGSVAYVYGLNVASLDTEILTDSPYGYWKLNETSGTTATDFGSGAQNMTYAGAYTLAYSTAVPTSTDKYILMTGTANASVTNQLGLAVPVAGDWTIEGIVVPYLDGTNQTGILTMAGQGETLATNFQFQVYLLATGEAAIFWEYGAGTNLQTNSGYVATSGQPLHVVSVKNSTAKTITFYFNGVKGLVKTYATEPAGGTSVSTYIGPDSTNTTNSPAIRSHIAYYTTQLSEARIQAHTKAAGLYSVGYVTAATVTGYAGSLGYTGSAGTGYTGSAGAGYTGSASTATGYAGSLGYTGSASTATGYTGSVGFAGSAGYTGSRGESSYTYSDTPPVAPAVGDRWFDSSSGLEFVWTDDGTSTQWVEIAASGFLGQTGYTGSQGNNSILQSASIQSASGTSVNFSSIQSWVKRITILFTGISTNGTSDIIIRIGTGSGFENTGYFSNYAGINSGGSSSSVPSLTTGFGVVSGVAAANIQYGIVTLVTMGNNIWLGTGTIARDSSTDAVYYTSGSKTLSGILDRIQLTMANGLDTFDAGSVNIIYE